MAAVDHSMELSRYDDLCRLCATKTTIILGINIFENEGSIRQLSKKIESCLPVQVNQSDELPKMICEDCLYKLELFFEFRERTVRTERLLLDLIKELQSERINNHQTDLSGVLSTTHGNLIMVPHHHLLEHTMQGVGDIDLSHSVSREGIIVGHEMVLGLTHPHHSVDISAHSLDNIDLNHHELTSQDLSNHSLRTQDSILLDTSCHPHSLQDSRFSNSDLVLIQQQHLLSDHQFRLHVDLVEENGISKVPVGSDFTNIDAEDGSSHTEKSYASQPINENSNSLELHSDLHTQSENSLTQLSDIHPHNFDLKLEDKTSEAENSQHILLRNNLDSLESNKLIKYALSNSSNSASASEYVFAFCNICGKSFGSKQQFDTHYETHFHTCKLCLVVFDDLETLNAHFEQEHHVADASSKEEPEEKLGEPLKCVALPTPPPQTDFELDNTDDDSDYDDPPEHVVKEEDDGAGDNDAEDKDSKQNGKKKKFSPKICQECGKAYKTNYKLTEHMRKHTGEKPFKCKSCDKAFRSKIGLAQHEAKHTGQYDFSCPTCGKGFQCKSYLMVHQRVHSDVKPYPCTTCGTNFKTKQSLLDHVNRHLGVKPFMCDVCGRSFITKGLCKAHQKIHTGVDNRKYSCKICNKRFVSKSYLQTHLRIHTGEKPFMCEVCGKGFLTRVDLKIHSTMHTGEKSYVCEICGKAFARRDALRCHRRSHTGERPYSCDLCGQTFTQFTPMAIHKRLHTGERPYSCETCDKTFVSRSTMLAHSKKHNNTVGTPAGTQKSGIL